jgi:peptidoglycan/xylan/chitin deacetylase (PgdA/CDA1 family)
MKAKIFLTIDCEDFINDRSMFALNRILELLHEYDLKGLFFLTGHVAEKVKYFPKILDLLEDEEIGYHSSSHSVRPVIIEYTDVENYEHARQISLKRETTRINPLTGELEGNGGLNLLRDLFPNKKITSFRAPGLSYSPPHLEALSELGIKYDFSTNLSKAPIHYKNLTFYPYPNLFDTTKLSSYAPVFKSLIQTHLAVLDFHPDYLVNSKYWDSIYFQGNPKRLLPVQARSWKETRTILKNFESFLRRLSYFEKKGIFEITPTFERGKRKRIFTKKCIMNSYQGSIRWAKKYLGYNPRFLWKHFEKFFDLANQVSNA